MAAYRRLDGKSNDHLLLREGGRIFFLREGGRIFFLREGRQISLLERVVNFDYLLKIGIFGLTNKLRNLIF